MAYDDLDYPRSPRDSRELPDYDRSSSESKSPEIDHRDDDNGDDHNIDSRSSFHDRTPRRLPTREPLHYDDLGPRYDRSTYRRPAASSQPRASSSATVRAPGSDSGTKPLIKPEANPVLGVFGLSIRTKERDLEDEFGRFGAVEKVVIVYDQRTDRSRGFGFITMRKTEEAKRAIEKLNGLTLHGRTIRVDFSATQKPHNPTPGEYMGAKRPILEDPRHDTRPPGPRDIVVDRYDDRRMDDRRRMDEWDRYSRDDRPYRDDRDMRPRDDYLPRRSEDPYGGRSRRDDYDRDRRRSPSPPPRRRRSPSPYRRPRDYDGYRRSRSPLPIPQDHLRY